jgi:hypothetical protein
VDTPLASTGLAGTRQNLTQAPFQKRDAHAAAAEGEDEDEPIANNRGCRDSLPMGRLRRPIFVLLAGLSVAGVASCAAPVAPAVAQTVERIVYRQQQPPFCGRCESTDFAVTDDGIVRLETGYWQDHYRDWRKVRRTRRLTPGEFRLLRDQISAYKPAQDILDPEAGCKNFSPDQGGAIIEWWNGAERRVRVFDFGCSDDPHMNAVVFDVLSLVLHARGH